MIRVNMIVEGQTEETFICDTVGEYLAKHNIFVSVRCVETGRKKGKIYRGGVTSYLKFKNDISRWMKEDSTAWYTMMLDYYALPDDFPGLVDSYQYPDIDMKAKAVENALKKDIGHRMFIPYIQMHEFEALLFSDTSKLSFYYFDQTSSIQNLELEVNSFTTPEHINNSKETAPSKRIIKYISEYEYQKATVGPMIAQQIGLPKIREKCPRFSNWLEYITVLE